MPSRIFIDRESLSALCRRYRIRRLSLFGSALRDDFRPDSDVDLLVEFESDTHIGLFEMAAIERDLSSVIGRRVDLRTPAELSRYFRDEVVASAEVQYAAG